MVRVSLTPAYSDTISTNRKIALRASISVIMVSLQSAFCPKMMPSTAEKRVSTSRSTVRGGRIGISHEGTSMG